MTGKTTCMTHVGWSCCAWTKCVSSCGGRTLVRDCVGSSMTKSCTLYDACRWKSYYETPTIFSFFSSLSSLQDSWWHAKIKRCLIILFLCQIWFLFFCLLFLVLCPLNFFFKFHHLILSSLGIEVYTFFFNRVVATQFLTHLFDKIFRKSKNSEKQRKSKKICF
jgi:hypothetical protein